VPSAVSPVSFFVLLVFEIVGADGIFAFSGRTPQY
jgi:hypothetical protein